MSDAGAPRRTLRIDLQFDGAAFDGWQRQPVARTVQGELEAALEKLLGAPHAVLGCGRTDAGVHALQHVSSCRTTHPMRVQDLARALAAILPRDIGVLGVREMEPAFHAQRDTLWKWYRYRILAGPRRRPLDRRVTWWQPRLPSLEALQAAVAPLVGAHDFASFANVGSAPRTTVRTVFGLTWSPCGEELHLDAVGDGFLYKMVRTIVGTAVQLARGPDPGAAMRAVLAARSRPAAGAPAPARGLCLMAIAFRAEPIPSTVPESVRPYIDSGATTDTTSDRGTTGGAT